MARSTWIAVSQTNHPAFLAESTPSENYGAFSRRVRDAAGTSDFEVVVKETAEREWPEEYRAWRAPPTASDPRSIIDAIQLAGGVPRCRWDADRHDLVLEIGGKGVALPATLVEAIRAQKYAVIAALLELRLTRGMGRLGAMEQEQQQETDRYRAGLDLLGELDRWYRYACDKANEARRLEVATP